MKHESTLLSLICAGALSPAAFGQVVQTYTFTTFSGGQASLAIPDGNAAGVSDTRSISGSGIFSIDSIRLSLDISAEFNGDLYGYLRHDSGFSVLLNRPGRASGNLPGYADSGINVTFEDDAVNGDIHYYQPASGNPLTGSWQTDARAIDPESSGAAFDAAPRTATLDSFAGLNGDGSWTLFLADVAGGAESVLNSWTLEITPVPEPHEYAIVVGIGLAAFALWRKRRPLGTLAGIR
jgi:subtilisin-like proprotein convertase family protein